MLPFTLDQFLDVFELYHEAWPHANAVLTAIAVVATAGAAVRSSRSRNIPVIALGVLWFWAGAVYHIWFFAPINPAAYLFGSLFIIQALIFAISAFRRAGSFEFRNDARTIVGAALIFYALVLYQIVGVVLGHQYPRAPSFGLPCPLTIFTFGLLLLSRQTARWYLLAIPVFWAIIGTSAAVLFGVWQDLGLPIALIAFIAASVLPRNKSAFVRPAGLS